jgi:hypothetical protein
MHCCFPFQRSCKFPKLPCLINLRKKGKCRKGEQINLKTFGNEIIQQFEVKTVYRQKQFGY